jgi:Fic/DOC family
VLNNLLGGPGFCPVVRWTERLRARAQSRLDLEMRAIIEAGGTQARTLAQNHIHADEAQSALALEGHPLSAPRFERFVASLKAAALFDMTNRAGLLHLQGAVADPRFAGTGWRKDQAFLGSLPAGSGGAVNLICPRPQDLPSLMDGWMTLTRRLQGDGIDPVVAAALSAFSFLFLRPFQDGNERMHSLIMHHMLIRHGFNPSSMVLPLSSVILGDRRGYAEAVESFGYPLFNYIEWRWAPGRRIVVTNDTADLYRYFDATALAEYLYDRVADAVRIDLPQTLDFTVMFDRAFATMPEIVDIPERRAELFLRSCLRNGGRLAWDRSKFPELDDGEVAALEALVQGAAGATRPASGARRKAAIKAGHKRPAAAESRTMRRNVMAVS